MRVVPVWAASFVAAVVLCAACGEEEKPPVSGVDGGGVVDAGLPDAGLPDGGAPDAGAPDAGVPDAGVPDAGAPDAGAPDAGVPDAGVPDGGVVVDFDIRQLQTGAVAANTHVRIANVVVTAIANRFNFYELFVQEPTGTRPFSGIEVRVAMGFAQTITIPTVGDLVTIGGVLLESGEAGFPGMRTSITLVDELTINGTAAVPEPVVVPQAALLYNGTETGPAEQWEGVLVRVEDVTVTAVSMTGELTLDQGLIVGTDLYRFLPPAVGTHYAAIIGPMDHVHGQSVILPRGPGDLIP